jgi:hypothetical protein
MNLGNLVVLVILVAVVGLVAYLAMSQASIPERMRRLFKQKIDDRADDQPRLGPRPNPKWDADPDRTNEAQELERVTGVMRNGEPFTIVSGDPSYWGSSNFEIEGLIVGVAEVETIDAGGNFQFRYCLVEVPGATPNTLIVEGDAPTSSVAYLGRAYGPDETVGDVRVGTIISRLQEERRRYRDLGVSEMSVDLPPYESATMVAARYEGRLALLESEPGKGYLPVSAANREGVRYSDLSLRLDPSGWVIRLVEVGAYSYLLELEPIRLGDLTVHHLA